MNINLFILDYLAVFLNKSIRNFSAIKIQNIYLDKQKGSYCFISIDKKNTVLLHHWKYFGYKQLKYNDKLVNILKIYIYRKNFNIYCKKI